jgi:hypothetical protein
MLLAPRFEDDGFDAGAGEQMTEHQTGRSGPDDADLRARACHRWPIMAQSTEIAAARAGTMSEAAKTALRFHQ